MLQKWRTIVGLILVYLAIWFELQWIWGILFLFWVVPDLISGSTFFMEEINKKEHPLLYWLIVVSWLLMALYSLTPIIYLFFPDWKYYS